MQSSMRSSKQKNKKGRNQAQGADATSFGNQSSVEFNRQGDADSGAGPSEQEPRPLTQALPYTFLLLEEKYLDGLDTRCIIQFDEEKFVACVWGTSEIFVIDREKPDAVNSFETGGS